MSEPSLGKDRQRALEKKDRQRALEKIWELWEQYKRVIGPFEFKQGLADAMLEFAAQEADWWVADLELGGMELDGDHKHLRKRAAELRAQKAVPNG